MLFMISPLAFLNDKVLLVAMLRVKRQLLITKVVVVLVFSAEIAESLLA